ncbi:hypothetical protein NDU88_002159 [Pleurodeles waltl]|uniref:Uncharacterized protein n=1 Tax=Pleurodeles waltl TaxID=8319 RepID=A0AAV7T222_PLEWA|nr:hypothetical protein NDU88_002159 [Pleurodeles waltl]
MDQTLTNSQKTNARMNPPVGSCQRPCRHRGGGASDKVLRTTPTAHQAKASQQEALMLAAALKVQPHCPSDSSPEGSAADSDTDDSMALFPSVTPQTAHDL